MKNVELLKGVLSAETYAKVVEESKNSEMSLADISSGNYVSKAKFEGVEGQLTSTKQLLTDKSKEYDDLKKMAGNNADLQKTIDDLKKTHQEELDAINTKATADALRSDTQVHIIQAFKPKDVADIMPYIDMEKVSRKDGKLIGVDEQVALLKENKAYFFEDDNDGQKGGNGGNPAGGLSHGGKDNDNVALRAAFGLNDKKE